MAELSNLDISADVPVADPVMTDEERQAFSAAVARGLAQGEAGEVVPGDVVFRWLESWGSDHELPPPRPGKPTAL